MRRNEAARAADSRLKRAALLEPVPLILMIDELVLLDLDASLEHALDAPRSAVIMERGALAGRPGHRDDGVFSPIIAMQQPAGIMIRVALEHARRQLNFPGIDEIA